MTALGSLGWDEEWSTAFEPYRASGYVPARVAVPHRGAYDVITADGETRARLPGRAWSAGREGLPVVGDWVALALEDTRAAVIRAVLPRRTLLSRRAAHEPSRGAGREQAVAANLDVVLVTLPGGREVDLRVLERYLTLVWESGAQPVVLLTKADLAPETNSPVDGLDATRAGVPVVAVSARSGVGLDRIRSILRDGVTGALVGPSGAGKSTLVNTLAGEDRLETGAVRRDGAGRHTTTRRELVVLPGGGVLVDNPGMREVHLWLVDSGLDEAFEDVVKLAASCRFHDCRHEREPGCAVRAAVESGRLAHDRLAGYLSLRREAEELRERLERRERSRARRGRPGAGAGSR